MSVECKCSNCNSQLTFPVEKVGQTIECSICHFGFVLPPPNPPTAIPASSPPPAQPTYLQSLLNRIFNDFEVKPSNEKAEIRCLVELTYFENQMLRLKGSKGVIRRALVRAQRIYCNEQNRELPKHFEKLTNDELSHLGDRIAKTTETLFAYLVPNEKTSSFFPREKRKMFLPISAFSIESKKRIFGFYSDIISEELAEISELRTNLTYPDKLIKPINELLQDLRRHFSIKDTSTSTEKLIVLRSAASTARESYYKLKGQLQNASPTEDTSRLESRLKKAQGEVSTLVSAIQKLEQSALLETRK